MEIYQLLIIVIIFNVSESLGVQSKHESSSYNLCIFVNIYMIGYMDNSGQLQQFVQVGMHDIAQLRHR